MGIAEITQGHKWKNFMKYLYGWGAAIVIVGALFKITHWPGATVLLTVGLLTEAVIFFFSAFEPLHEEVDWTLAYPELAGIEEDIEVKPKPRPTTLPASDGVAMAEFNKMIEGAGNTNLFKKFGKGIENLNGKVGQLSDISDATLATNEYSESMKSASETVDSFNNSYKTSSENVNNSMNGLSNSYKNASENVNETSNKVSENIVEASSGVVDAYKQTVENINYSANGLSDSFSKVSQLVSESGDDFSSAYKRLTGSMELDFSSLKDGNLEYNEHIGKLNKNLTALNAIFELQLNEVDLDKMMRDLEGSVKHSAKYNEEVTKLGKRLEALNTVYGNMLSAMNVNID